MNQRNAFTLIELVVSVAAATLLMAGLASALYISVQVFDAQFATMQATRAAEVQADLLQDLSRATAFTSRTADTITFTVPDETGDSAEDTLSYVYDSGGGTLSLSLNGSSTTLLSGVTASSFGFLQRTMAGSAPVPTPYDINDWGMRWGGGVTFEGFTEVKEAAGAASVSLAVPAGTSAGDLLIAAFAIDGGPTPAADPAWNVISFTNNASEVQLAVWWKIASASEPSSYDFTFSTADQMYGWMMRFTGHNPSSPIDSYAVFGVGEPISTYPTSPEVTTTVDGCMILRLGGFDGGSINVDDAGIANHTTISMDSNTTGTSGVTSGGAAHTYQGSAGASGTANFTLTSSEEYVSVTIAIAPE